MDNYSVIDNTIEFLRNEKRATVTFSQGKYISKIRKLAESNPDECQIVAENSDSIVAHIPVSWVKISANKRVMSEEQRKAAGERLKKMREKKEKNNG